MSSADPRYVVICAQDIFKSNRVQIKERDCPHLERIDPRWAAGFWVDDLEAVFPDEKPRARLVLRKGAKVLAVFAPGQLRLYPLTGEPPRPVPPPSFRLLHIEKAELVPNRRTVFEDGTWEVFYTTTSQRRSAMWWVERAETVEGVAEALVALERVIKARAYGGELTEEEMGPGWETYRKILARALGTTFAGEREVALRMALKRALALAGIRRSK